MSANSHLTFGRREKAKIKKCYIRRPTNRKPNLFTNWIFYWKIRLCIYYGFSLKKMPDICEVWKYWPLRDGFRSILQKFYRAAILWRVDQKTFSRHFFWQQLSKYCIAKFTAIFVCLLLSWSRPYSTKWSSNFDGP